MTRMVEYMRRCFQSAYSPHLVDMAAWLFESGAAVQQRCVGAARATETLGALYLHRQPKAVKLG